MAMVHCPKCNREISDTAKSCPGCGFDRTAIRAAQVQKTGFLFPTDKTVRDLFFYILGIFNFGLIVLILLFSAFIYPYMADAYAGLGMNLSWFSRVFFRLGNYALRFWVVSLLGLGSMAGLLFFHPKIRQKVKVKYLAVSMVCLSVLFVVLVANYYFGCGGTWTPAIYR